MRQYQMIAAIQGDPKTTGYSQTHHGSVGCMRKGYAGDAAVEAVLLMPENDLDLDPFGAR